MTRPAVGVVGLGAMGLGIAQVFLTARHPVVVTDVSALARGAAPTLLDRAMATLVEKGRLTVEAREAALGRLHVAADLAALAPAALVVEAVVEDAAVKRALFADLARVVGPETILATNTSSLRVAALADGAPRPERVLGLHFFNPAPVMRLVELVPHAGTATVPLARARALVEGAGKTVVTAPDRPGFIVNRVARPFYGEALALAEEGLRPADIDAAMRDAGYRMGPFALIDLVGADINLAATAGMYGAMAGHPRYHVFATLARQVETGALGRKAGRGFLVGEPEAMTPDDAGAIVQRIEATIVNEAGWLLAEGGVTGDAIDTAVKLGLNWPQGPFEMLRAHGREEIAGVLASLAARAPAHLAGRYDPAPVLQ